jgi:hypothetical protein
MSAGRTGTVIQIAGDAMFVVMVLMTVFMGVLMDVFTLMDMCMAVLAAVGVMVGMRMDAGQHLPAAVRMIMIVAMGVAMHRAVLVNMRVFVRTLRRPALDLHFTRAATANCTHAILSYSISISLTRISVPPVGRS